MDVIGLDKKNLFVKDSIPHWHKNILNERTGDYKAGKTSLTKWEDFNEELNKEDMAEFR